jgi:hypothetical protein
LSIGRDAPGGDAVSDGSLEAINRESSLDSVDVVTVYGSMLAAFLRVTSGTLDAIRDISSIDGEGGTPPVSFTTGVK